MMLKQLAVVLLLSQFVPTGRRAIECRKLAAVVRPSSSASSRQQAGMQSRPKRGHASHNICAHASTHA